MSKPPIHGYVDYAIAIYDSSNTDYTTLNNIYGLDPIDGASYSSNISVEESINYNLFKSFWQNLISPESIPIFLNTEKKVTIEMFQNVGTDIFNIYTGAYPEYTSLGSEMNTVLSNMYLFGKTNGIYNNCLKNGVSSYFTLDHYPASTGVNWKYLLNTCGNIKDGETIYKYNTVDLYDNINLRSWCGCFTNPIKYKNNVKPALPTFPNQCMPTCVVPEAVKLINETGDSGDIGNILQCEANICVIDDITIQTFESSGGPITFNQICTGCVNSGNPCICIVQEDIDGGRIGNIKVNFNQVCPRSICFKEIGDDGNPKLDNPFECPSTTPGGNTGGGNTGGGGETPQPGQNPKEVVPKYIINNNTILSFFILLLIIILILFLSSFISTRFLPIKLPKPNN